MCIRDSLLPVQRHFSPPVVLPSFLSRFALVRKQIDSNTTGSQKKIWTVTTASCSLIPDIPRDRIRATIEAGYRMPMPNKSINGADDKYLLVVQNVRGSRFIFNHNLVYTEFWDFLTLWLSLEEFFTSVGTATGQGIVRVVVVVVVLVLVDVVATFFWRSHVLPVQIFPCDPAVMVSICYRTGAKQQIHRGNTTGGLKKNWTGRSILY